MARPQTYQSFCYNSLPTYKDELPGGTSGALIKNNSTFASTPIPAVSRIPTLALAPVPPGGTYTNMNLQRTTKLALDSFVQGQAYVSIIES